MQALGLIETYGFVAAVEACDASLKAANVSLQGVKFVRGGLVTAAFLGDVGAVKAAVDAGAAAASKVGTVLSTHVIPRPADGIDKIMLDNGFAPPKPQDSPKTPEPPKMESASASETVELKKIESAAAILAPSGPEPQAPRPPNLSNPHKKPKKR